MEPVRCENCGVEVFDNDGNVYIAELGVIYCKDCHGNLKKIADRIRDGYSEGDGWRLLIEISIWENLKDDEVEEIASQIEQGKTSSYFDPCGWDLVIE